MLAASETAQLRLILFRIVKICKIDRISWFNLIYLDHWILLLLSLSIILVRRIEQGISSIHVRIIFVEQGEKSFYFVVSMYTRVDKKIKTTVINKLTYSALYDLVWCSSQ